MATLNPSACGPCEAARRRREAERAAAEAEKAAADAAAAETAQQ